MSIVEERIELSNKTSRNPGPRCDVFCWSVSVLENIFY